MKCALIRLPLHCLASAEKKIINWRLLPLMSRKLQLGPLLVSAQIWDRLGISKSGKFKAIWLGTVQKSCSQLWSGEAVRGSGRLTANWPTFSVQYVAAGTSVGFKVWRIYASGKSKPCSRKAAEQVEFHWHAAVRLSGTNKPLSVLKDMRPVTEIKILNNEKK